MRKCARSYPVSAIDGGVKNCIANSRNLLESAQMLAGQRRFEHSFVLYTYAQEKFGKALLLLDKKSEAQSKGDDWIRNDEVIFCDHEPKLKRAEAYDSQIGVKLIDESTIPVIDVTDLSNPGVMEKFKFGGRNDFQYENGSYSNLDTRFNFLYIDIDQTSYQWQTKPFKPSQLELDFAYEALRDALNALEQKLNTQK